MKIYTIGHSTHTIEKFTEMVIANVIDTIVDVRSLPYSKFAPQFNREDLNSSLSFAKVKYIFMGDLLGARHQERNLLFDDGKVNFKKVQQTSFFKKGIERLENGIQKGHNIALMCSEEDAFMCHRFALISEYLASINIDVSHIFPSHVYSNSELEIRLIDTYDNKINRIDLLLSHSEIPIEQALLLKSYEIHNMRIAYANYEEHDAYSAVI